MVKVHPGIGVAYISGCIDGTGTPCVGVACVSGCIDGEGTPKSWCCLLVLYRLCRYTLMLMSLMLVVV